MSLSFRSKRRAAKAARTSLCHAAVAAAVVVSATLVSVRASVPRREWTVAELPSPLNDTAGVCGRSGRPSAVCDPDHLLSESAACDIDAMVTKAVAGNDRAARNANTDKQRGQTTHSLIVVVLNEIRLENISVQERSRRFANELQASWRPEGRSDLFAVLLIVKMHGQVQLAPGLGTKQPHKLMAVISHMRAVLIRKNIDDAVIIGVRLLTFTETNMESSGEPGRNWFLVHQDNDLDKPTCRLCRLKGLFSALFALVGTALHVIYFAMSWLVWMTCCVLVYLIIFEVIRACVRAFEKSHNSARRHEMANPWLHISFISSELAARERTYELCEQALLRIERDRERARCGVHLPLCCPLCLADFDPGSSEAAHSGSVRVRNTSPARPSASESTQSGYDDVESQVGDGEESQPLLQPRFLESPGSSDGTRSWSGPSIENFALAVSSDVTLLVLLVMTRSTLNVGQGRALEASFPSMTVSLRCGHHFHTKCLSPMLLVLQDLCPVCLSNLFQTRTALGRDWDSFYDEYMFRVRRIRFLYAEYVSDDMVKRWLNVTPYAGIRRSDPPMVRDFEFRTTDRRSQTTNQASTSHTAA